MVEIKILVRIMTSISLTNSYFWRRLDKRWIYAKYVKADILSLGMEYSLLIKFLLDETKNYWK